MNKKFLLLLLLINIITKNSASSLKLHNAASRGDAANLMQAFRDRAPLDLQDDTGKTALHSAAANKNNLRLKNYSTGTLIAQLLIEHGANPDIFNKKDERPIDVALNNGNQSLAALLMRHSHPEIPLQDGSTLFETAIDKFKRNDHSCIRALMDNPRFNVRESIEQATMSGNFEVASFMRQYQAQKELTQTRGQKRKSGSQENSAAKRRKLAEEEEEEEEVCFCCQEPINDTDNPGTQIFQCSHYLHEGCWQGLKSNGYATCQICQASLKEPIAMPTTGKTVAQQEQEERDAMLASLLAADIIDPDELNFFQS